jgi:hypothetical protein
MDTVPASVDWRACPATPKYKVRLTGSKILEAMNGSENTVMEKEV